MTLRRLVKTVVMISLDFVDEIRTKAAVNKAYGVVGRGSIPSSEAEAAVGQVEVSTMVGSNSKMSCASGIEDTEWSKVLKSKVFFDGDLPLEGEDVEEKAEGEVKGLTSFFS